MNENNLEQLKKIVQALSKDNVVITSKELDQLFAGIIGILASHKKSTEVLNQETKDLIETVMGNVERRHAQVLNELGENTQKSKTDLMSEFGAKIEEVRQLVKDFQAIKPKDGISPNKDEILAEIMGQIKLPEYEKVTLDTAEQMVAKINSLDTKDPEHQIDFTHIKNAPNFTEIVRKENKMLVGGRIFAQMADVSFSNLQDGDIVKWDAANLRFTNGTGGTGSVTSVFGRTGVVVAQNGDYNTSQVTENTNLYFTQARVLSTPLTGYTSGAGTISATDTILQAIQKLNGNTALLTGAVIYQGTWNANTNTPTLTSGIGTKGFLYKVSTAGSTNLDGITQWNIGDAAVFNGSTWDKIDGIANEVLSVNGLVGAVALTGTANRITVSAANVFDISASYVGQSSITTLGTITTGTLSTGAIIGGVTMTLGSDASYDMYYRNASGILTRIPNGTTGQLLKATTGGAPAWATVSTGSGTVTSVASADGSITVTNGTTTPDLSVVSAPKWSTARTLAGNSVDGSANVAFANKFIVQGTSDAGLSAAQFLGALGTGILKNTTSTGILSIAVAADFPTLNQNTTGSAATLTTPRAINGVNFDGSAAITVTAAAGTLTGTTLNSTVVTSSLTSVGTLTNLTVTNTITGSISGASGSAPMASRTITQTSHGFSVGNVLKFTGGAYALAKGDSSANAEVLGIITTVVDANNFILTTHGYITGLSGFTANTEYFLDPAVAGGLTSTAPVTIGQISKPVFFALTTTTGYFINYRGIAVTAAAVTAAGGSNTQLQYNNSAAFGGISGATSNGTAVTFANAALLLAGSSSGTTQLNATAAASGVLTLPAATDTLIGKATTDILTNKTYDTAGAGNVFKINGTSITATSGSGSVVLGTTPTIATPVINGTVTGTGVATASTASTLAQRDTSGNLTSNNTIEGYATTATAAGTTTLTVTSAFQQYFTGSSTQTVVLPVTSTLGLGFQFLIVNNSTGAVTVQSSGANAIVVLAGGTSAMFTVILATGTTAASWSFWYAADFVASGKKVTFNNTITFAGTDATTMTFPTTTATIARTDAGQTFTGTNAFGVITATTLNGNTFTTGTYTLTGTAGKTLNFQNTITFAAGADGQTFTFPSASATIAGLGTTQTFTGINTFTPAARSSGVASYFTLNAPADTGQTTATESIGMNIVGATRTWVDGTVATQREYLFQKPTYNKTTTSATFTKAATLAISGAPVAGTGVTITNPFAFWVQAGASQFDGNILMGAAINEFQGADIASAGTTDIGAATGNYINVTGTTTITALGTVASGTRREVKFAGILILTYNATSLILPTAASITTAAGDTATFISLGSGNWICTKYQRASGAAVAGGGGGSWKAVTGIRGGTDATSSVSYAHGLGKTPAFVRITAYLTNHTAAPSTQIANSAGTYDGTTNNCISEYVRTSGSGATAHTSGSSATKCVNIVDDSGNGQNGSATVDATNVNISFTNVGGGIAAVNIQLLIEVFG